MRVLILGSVALPVPPLMQGGTERIAYAQAVGLAGRGHEVILVAAKGSQANSAYRLVEIGGGDTVSGSSRLPTVANKISVESSRNLRKEAVYLSEVGQWLIDHDDEYDVIINNMRAGEAIFLPIVSSLKKRMINVMHLPLFEELAALFMYYNTPVVTISNAQRQGFDGLNYVGTAYNGIDVAEFVPAKATGPAAQQPQNHPQGDPDFGAPRFASPIGRSGDYLLMMGSIAPHKNQKEGIAVAKAVGMPLIMAGKIGNQIYFDREIAPSIDGKTVIHKGELSMVEKRSLYQSARALVFPILWEEPFGLVMIEAMACGIPVVAYARGAVPEVIVDGKTGFIVEPEGSSTSDVAATSDVGIIQTHGTAGLVAAVKRIDEIDRAACRAHVEAHFTVEKMIDAYEQALKTVGAD